MRSEPWTVERIALLRKLWSEGETAVVIADRLGGIVAIGRVGKDFSASSAHR